MQSNWNLRRLRLPDTALVITIIVLLSFSVILFVIPAQDDSFTEIFTSEHVQLLNMHNTAAQRTAHRVALVLLAVLSIICCFLIYRRSRFFTSRSTRIFGSGINWIKRYSGIFVLLATAVFLVGIFQAESWIRGVILIRLGEIILSAFVILSFVFLYGQVSGQKAKSAVFSVIIWILIIAYLLWLIIPGFILPLSFFAESQFWLEAHYNVTLAQADRLAAGLQFGTEVNLNYGLIPPLLLAIFERSFGLLDFAGHFVVVQITQIIFLITAIVTFHLWKPRNPLFVLFATLLIGTWVSTAHSAIYFPNQSGWRFIGLALGVLFLLLIRFQTLSKAAFILGLGTVFLILYNPETGICLTFGYGLFLLSRLRTFNIAAIFSLAIRFIIGATIASLGIILLYRIGLGEFPTINPALFLGFIGRFGEGYSGLALKFDPFALIIFVYSVFIVALMTLRWWRRELSVNESVRLAISSTILVWFSYYFNRPDPWNLWTYQYLFVFLIADLVNPAVFTRLRHNFRKCLFDVRLALMLFVLLPFIINQNYLHLKMIFDQTFSPTSGQITRVVSGVPMSEQSANDLLSKAAYLEKTAPDTLFFTHNSYSLSLLTKRFVKLPIQDIFGETITKQDFENLIGTIQRNPPKLLLFETFETNLGENQIEELKYYESFFGRVKNRLAQQYQLKETTNNWEVWELKQSSDAR